MKKKVLTKQVGVLFTDGMYKKLVAMTDLKEVPMSELIRQIVEKELNFAEKEEIENE